MNQSPIKTYEESFTLRVRDCDVNGVWRLSAILECMQEAAGAHSLLLGCGREDLLRQQMVWVLSRYELQMDRYPVLGETITVQTFPMPIRRYFFPRYFLLTDQHGELVGKAVSLWLLLDIRSRHMLPPGDIARLIPDNRDLSVPMNLPATIGALQGEEFVSEYLPKYSDLDVNGHVNNTKYADWLCNTLGLEVMTQYEPASIMINYNAEILPNQRVVLHQVRREQEYRLAGYVGDKAAFEIGGHLRIRSAPPHV